MEHAYDSAPEMVETCKTLADIMVGSFVEAVDSVLDELRNGTMTESSEMTI